MTDPDQQLPTQNDQVIGSAFRASLVVIAGIAVVVGLVVTIAIWRASNQPEESLEETSVVVVQATSPKTDREPPTVTFEDITHQAGINFTHVNGAYGERLLPETMGGGVAFFDYDNDGDQDLLLVNSKQWPWQVDGPTGGAPALYENDGTGQFRDVSEARGLTEIDIYGMGVAIADVDGDGWRDVLLTAVGPNVFLRNVRGDRFEDTTDALALAGDDQDWSTGAAFFDADNDGDLDLFVCNYVKWSREIDQAVDYQLTGVGRAYGPPTNYEGTYSRLYRNDRGTFVDVSAESGIQVINASTGVPAGKALAVLPIDLDEDGDMDLVVANDTVANFVFINQGDGRFEEAGTILGLAFDNTGHATGAMGIDAALLSDDRTAIAIGNFANEMTSFYTADRGNLSFSDQSIIAGIGAASRQALSFGLFFFDYDLDGRMDLLQVNGHVEDEINVVQPSQNYEQPSQLFWNCGVDCARRYVQIGTSDLGGLAKPLVGRGAAYADIDVDGDLDVIVTQIGRPPLLVRNNQQLGNNWLRVTVRGEGYNRDALGARVTVSVRGESETKTVMPTRSYLAQVELPLVFGLGLSEVAEQVEVEWPDGRVRRLRSVGANQAIMLEPSE